MSLHPVPFLVCAAHKNFAVLVEKTKMFLFLSKRRDSRTTFHLLGSRTYIKTNPKSNIDSRACADGTFNIPEEEELPTQI